MMSHLTLVMPYYKNPSMLALHYETWRRFPDSLKSAMDVVIVDDGSPVERADYVPIPPDVPNVSIYRVMEDRPWHQHGARNLGAHVARGPWLLLTDMDHLLTEINLRNLLLFDNERVYYTLNRLDAPHLKPTLDKDGMPKPHPNSFVMTKKLYWKVGGYDEDYCGIYGTDGLFRSRLNKTAPKIHLPTVSLIRYPRDVVHDASTRYVLRKEGRDFMAKRSVATRKAMEGRADKIVTLNFPWERIL